jgi:uncharacterized protein (DUF433 family)
MQHGSPRAEYAAFHVQFLVVGAGGDPACVDENLQEYKGLSKEDILACLFYASETLENTPLQDYNIIF